MYEFIETVYGDLVIKRNNADGTISYIPTTDSANSDYQQYLLDTDGGLPIPGAKK